MSPEAFVGWDLGGAHLKVACLDAEGYVLHSAQWPCPLWQGLEPLRQGLERAIRTLRLEGAHHAFTMTGELVDLFRGRREGVRALIRTVEAQVSSPNIAWYAGPRGLLDSAATLDAEQAIASSNWLASATFTARRVPQALLVDIGSTTTDIVAIRDAEVLAHGGGDHQRLRCGELLYTGVVRTPLMALAQSAPFNGAWVAQMAEQFALSADVYRLTGELPAHADQLPSADAGPKTVRASARRLARMLGLDDTAAGLEDWRRLACYYRECQLHAIARALHLVVSERALDAATPLVGCGVGRFLVRHLAARCARRYIDMASLVNTQRLRTGAPADCLPALAVAELARGRA